MKRKKLLTRRRRAVRWAVLAALVILAANQVLRTALLLPIQAIRQAEEMEGTGRTQVVEKMHVEGIRAAHLLYLTENENAALMASTYLTAHGWETCQGMALDCSGDAPLYAGYYQTYQVGGGEAFCLFGRVEDPTIETLAFRLSYRAYGSSASDYQDLEETASVVQAEFLEKEDRRYFLLRLPPANWRTDCGVSISVTAYDAEGRAAAELEHVFGQSWGWS